eukprot:646953-Rhodomonas_salina.3
MCGVRCPTVLCAVRCCAIPDPTQCVVVMCDVRCLQVLYAAESALPDADARCPMSDANACCLGAAMQCTALRSDVRLPGRGGAAVDGRSGPLGARGERVARADRHAQRGPACVGTLILIPI